MSSRCWHPGCGKRGNGGAANGNGVPVTANMFEDGPRPVIIASLEVVVPQSNRSHAVSRVALTLAMIVAAVIGTRGAVVAERLVKLVHR